MASPHGPGILLVDKPGGMTSHDVVSRARKALGTRKIGHAGTLDPLATGLLLLGVDSATRLLTYLVGLDKTYEATIRLGAATDSDDSDGEIVSRADPRVLAAVDAAAIQAPIAALTGRISQVPSTVSAIKIGGRRAYDLARAGEEVVLASREVTVSRFEVLDIRRTDDGTGTGSVDVDVVVDCSSGTYIRALARDLGSALGVGGHLTALRRTRVGPFGIADAVGPDAIATEPLLSSADVAVRVLGGIRVTDAEASALRHGQRLTGAAGRIVGEHAAAIDPAGELIGVVGRRGDDLKSLMNLPTGAARDVPAVVDDGGDR
ncbi:MULTISPECIES: tRNA pseudouridine(55) synthase TruB [unclassified Microbacterium]|uniref:tRNA pseudouridine(55) synthase TruB n=1 Tax=unclassified Microbacterium TaxID=2609290 RepID=UPI000C2BA6B2|nr:MULTISPECIES: tRNA pseudouridine(55) synthase TruB [unclassified Microbacterium]